jgi:hypothetical protein
MLMQTPNATSVSAPAGTNVIVYFRGIGTQNYTSRESDNR